MRRWTPFGYGFRPFFLAALLYAPLAVLAWLWMRAVGTLPLEQFPPHLWHGHEMIFGFVAAAIAGFLLTAVPSWTGARGFAGAPLIILTMLWLAGRLAFAIGALIPLPLLVAAELAFFPALVFLLAPPLLRERNRNTPLLIVLAAFWAADATFLHALAHAEVTLATTTLRGAVNLVLLLVTIIGGRIVPAFTASALRRRGIEPRVRTRRWLEIVVITAMALAIVVDLFAPYHELAIFVAAVAACAHVLRMSGWQGLRTLREPIVWVLHLGYMWLPVGLALKALYLGLGVNWAMQWLHALTMGAMAMMIVAVVTRASLGHTGRPLTVPRSTAVAYGLLAGAVLLRVFGEPLFPDYESALRWSGGLWFAAFVMILLRYAPILLRARVDGKPG